MTSQVQLTEEQLKKVEKAFEELQRLHFHIGMKKPEEWLYRLKHVLKMLPKEMRKTALAHLMATGHIRLPIIKVVARKINWERLEKAFESFLQTLPEWQREKYEKLIAELKEKMAQLKGEYKNYEEFVQELQKIMGEVSKETVINLGPFLSSLASYLAEQGLSQSQIQNIIKEIENKVFGGPVNYYIVKNEQELENIIKKIGQILQEHGIQTYEVITKLLPIETKVVYTSPENIKKAVKYILQKIGIPNADSFAPIVAREVENLLVNKKTVSLLELGEAIAKVISNILMSKGLIKLPKDLVVSSNNRRNMLQLYIPDKLSLEEYKTLVNALEKLAVLYHSGYERGMVEILRKLLPSGWRVNLYFNVYTNRKIPGSGGLIIYTPSGKRIIIYGYWPSRETIYKLAKILKTSIENIENIASIENNLKKAFFEYFKKTGVAGVSAGEFYRILEEGWKKKELPFKVESYVTYQKTVEIKVPTFYETFSKLAAKYAMGAGEVLERFRQWLEKEWKNITEAVTRPVYIEWRII